MRKIVSFPNNFGDSTTVFVNCILNFALFVQINQT